jgi:DNA-directed RNA polymerase specialized sigma24 family protein
MKKNTELANDVEKLAKQSVAAEAEARVWKIMDRALSELDEESRDLLSDYFNGSTVEELSAARGLSPKNIEAWIARSKRELVKRLRAECTVRQ